MSSITDIRRLSRTARQDILNTLEQNLSDPSDAFKALRTKGIRRSRLTPITESTPRSPKNLSTIFGKQLDSISGSHHIVRQGETVAGAILERITQIQENEKNTSSTHRVLSWNLKMLDIAGMLDTLHKHHIELVVPHDLHDGTCRAEASSISIGITGVEAAMASTATVALSNGPGMNRVASLLPLHHILLIPQDRIYPNVEAWFGDLKKENKIEQILCENSQLSLVTGPSKSADIELTLTLGVHGPRTVHAIIYKNS
jgi:L-lactate dehydrogenase complex protein LldG